MCNMYEILEVVSDMFKDTGTVVSVGIKAGYNTDPTILLDGCREFNPTVHRRHCFDLMLHYNLYLKCLKTGGYVAGRHGDERQSYDFNPLVALTKAARDLKYNA